MKALNKKLKFFFKKQDEVLVAYLFGSYARKQVTPLSDIDIGILVDADKVEKKDWSFGYQIHLSTKLSQYLKMDDIDLVILNRAPILLKHRCVFGGKLIYCRDKRYDIELKVRTLLEYLDTQPLRLFLRKKLYGGHDDQV